MPDGGERVALFRGGLHRITLKWIQDINGRRGNAVPNRSSDQPGILWRRVSAAAV